MADVITLIRARQQVPDQSFLSLAVAPPHLHQDDQAVARRAYEDKLRTAGADLIVAHTTELSLELLKIPLL